MLSSYVEIFYLNTMRYARGAVRRYRREARTFIEAMRLTLSSKTGFRWLAERLSGLLA